MVCSNSNFGTEIMSYFRQKTMGYIYSSWYFVKNRPQNDLCLNKSSERPLSKCSENHNVIGPTELSYGCSK